MKTLIIAHRGASDCAPENTLAAFQRACALGADGIELDVTLTRDSVPVVIHDDTVDRTTNGKGAVAQMTLEEIRSLDAGSWYSAEFRAEKIPTLAEVFQAVGHRAIVNVELKGTTLKADGLEAAVIRAVESAGMQERVILSSFNPIRLWRAARTSPNIERGLLYMDSLPIYLRRAWFRPLLRPAALHPIHRMVTPGYVRWARKMGYKINTWTVDDPSEMKRLIGLEVDAIITKRPDILKQMMTVT
jgi:glycerophosphoryl diester phosphodiesterase